MLYAAERGRGQVGPEWCDMMPAVQEVRVAVASDVIDQLLRGGP